MCFVIVLRIRSRKDEWHVEWLPDWIEAIVKITLAVSPKKRFSKQYIISTIFYTTTSTTSILITTKIVQRNWCIVCTWLIKYISIAFYSADFLRFHRKVSCHFCYLAIEIYVQYWPNNGWIRTYQDLCWISHRNIRSNTTSVFVMYLQRMCVNIEKLAWKKPSHFLVWWKANKCRRTFNEY